MCHLADQKAVADEPEGTDDAFAACGVFFLPFLLAMSQSYKLKKIII